MTQITIDLPEDFSDDPPQPSTANEDMRVGLIAVKYNWVARHSGVDVANVIVTDGGHGQISERLRSHRHLQQQRPQ